MNSSLSGMGRWLIRFVGLVLFIYLLSRVNFHQVKVLLGMARVEWLVLAFLLNLPFLWLKAVRWRGLLESMGFSLEPYRSLQILGSGVFFGMATPARSGDVIRVALYRRLERKAPITPILASVILDRMCDLVCVIGFFLIVLALRPEPWAYYFRWIFVFFIILPAFGVLFIARYKKRGHSPENAITRFLSPFMNVSFRSGVMAIGLTVVAYTFFFMQGYLVSVALGFTLRIFDIVGALSGGSLIALIPVSIAGLGTRDAWIIKWLQEPLVYSQAFAFSFLTWLVQYAGGAFLGCLAWISLPHDLRRSDEKQVDTAGSEV